MQELSQVGERAMLSLGGYAPEPVKWRAHVVAETRHYKTRELIVRHEEVGNILVLGGASVLWEAFIGNGSTSTGSAKHFFNSKCALGIGDTTSAAANTQKTLSASSGAAHRIWKIVSAAPTHTTGSTIAAAAQLQFKSTFTTAQANFKWGEWGVFNIGTTAAVQRMLNRKAGVLLTKTSAATASLTVTLTLS